jgi:hypothetical protein
MLPGPDNKTAPFIYSTQHPRPRRISFVDIDTRDMRFKIVVDGKLKRTSTDFEVDRGINCGQSNASNGASAEPPSLSRRASILSRLNGLAKVFR